MRTILVLKLEARIARKKRSQRNKQMERTPPTLEGTALATIRRINEQLPKGAKLLTIDNGTQQSITIGPGFDLLEEERLGVREDDVDEWGGKNLVEKNLRAKIATGLNQASVVSIHIFSRKS